MLNQEKESSPIEYSLVVLSLLKKFDLNEINEFPIEEIHQAHTALDRCQVLSIGLVESNLIADLQTEFHSLKDSINFDKSHFVILLPYKEPPKHYEAETAVRSTGFLVSLSDFFLNRFYQSPASACFNYAYQITQNTTTVDQFIIHQLGRPCAIESRKPGRAASSEVIIPHQGDLNFLRSACHYLQKQSTNPEKISICFDEELEEEHFNLASEITDIHFHASIPSACGPYPARQLLSSNSRCEALLFQDSDDVPTTDRLAVLKHQFISSELDAVGSHELRLNLKDKTIETHRFPSVVNQATNEIYWFNIFLPTTLIKKDSFEKIGGFSTIRRHTSDTQFFLRAHFLLNLGNVNDFLYLRVHRSESLTNHASTGIHSPVRERLHSRWVYDFEKVQNKQVSLYESCLVDEPNNACFHLVPLLENKKLLFQYQQILHQIRENQFCELSGRDSTPRQLTTKASTLNREADLSDSYSANAVKEIHQEYQQNLERVRKEYQTKFEKIHETFIGRLGNKIHGWKESLFSESTT